jgi:hypothetical protein
MDKNTIIYEINDDDNTKKLKNIFNELQVNYQLQRNTFTIYIPDVVVATPVNNMSPQDINKPVEDTKIKTEYEKTSNRVCVLCSICQSK